MDERRRSRAEQVLRAPKVSLVGWTPDGSTLVAKSERGGVAGLWTIEVATGDRSALATPDDVVGVARLAGSRATVLYELEHDGDEVGQLFAVPLATRVASPLVVEPGVIHHLGPVASDLGLVAYASNREEEGRFDVRVRDLATGDDRVVWSPGGFAYPLAWSPDGTRLLVGRTGRRSIENELGVLTVATGALELVSVEGERPASWGEIDGRPAVAWRPDGSGFLFVTDHEREYLHLAEWRDGRWRRVLEAERDLRVALDPTGTRLVVTVTSDGSTSVTLHDAATFAPLRPVSLPGVGVASDVTFSPDGSRVAFVFQSATVAGDVWIAELDGEGLRRLTGAPEDDFDDLATPTLVRVTSFDGEPVPCFVYRPPVPIATPPPVVIVIHGGPEAEAKNDFERQIGALVAAGFAVVRPNVRGSTGYGRRYAHLDDAELRLDPIRDLVAIRRWIEATGLGDPDRVFLWGVSYGGMATHLALAHFPHEWAGAVAVVGASSIATFLETIAPWRRPIREAEYGALDEHRGFFERIAALTHAEQMVAPLLLVHSRNDIRVPIAESLQLQAALRRAGREPGLVVFEDDGHMIGRVANRTQYVIAGIEFLETLPARTDQHKEEPRASTALSRER